MTGPIGVDLDNTLVSYDRSLGRLAVRWGLLEAGQARGKRAIRDALRRLPGGEVSWQKLQAEAYGPAMGQAQPMPAHSGDSGHLIRLKAATCSGAWRPLGRSVATLVF